MTWLGGREGLILRRRWNRWYAMHEYLLEFDQPWSGENRQLWLLEDDIETREPNV